MGTSARSAKLEQFGELSLTEKQRSFAYHIAAGKDVRRAAVLAGYVPDKLGNPGGNANNLLKNPRVVALINSIRAKNEKVVNMQRKRVLEGFLEAIEQAKMMAEPMTQIAGWREIGKLCGYYAPEVKNINVNVSAQRLVGKFEMLSDQELLEMIDQDKEAIEGEAMLLAESLPSAQDVVDAANATKS